jgi:hypothetical protein
MQSAMGESTATDAARSWSCKIRLEPLLENHKSASFDAFARHEFGRAFWIFETGMRHEAREIWRDDCMIGMVIFV